MESKVAQTVNRGGPAKLSGEFTHVPLGDLVESRTNPRKHFDKAGLQELAASIREQGILSPLLVRNIQPKTAGEQLAGGHGMLAYEVVCGARRLRAARIAGVDQVPVHLVDLTDAQALELQVIENLQREDVHPMDEALGYQALLGQAGSGGVEAIAAKVGKSTSYVYSRLRYASLSPKARDAFLADQVTASVALVIARIPNAQLQDLAVKELATRPGEEPCTLSEARRTVQQRFMRSLKAAPFSLASGLLLESAGPCTSCPKRTGAQAQLFDDVTSPDVCTDPPCYERKVEAHWRANVVPTAKAAGARVVAEGKPSKEDRALVEKIFPWRHSPGNVAHEYIDLADHDYGHNKTYKKLLGGLDGPNAARLVVVKDLEGKPHELIRRADLPAAMKAAGVKRPARDSATSYEAQHRRQVEIQRRHLGLVTRYRTELLERIHAAGAREPVSVGLTSEDLVTVANAMLDRLDGREGPLGLLAGLCHIPLEQDRKKRARQLPNLSAQIREHFRDLGDVPLGRMLLVMAMAENLVVAPYNASPAWSNSATQPADLLALAKRYGIDAAGIRERLATEASRSKKASKKGKARRAA